MQFGCQPPANRFGRSDAAFPIDFQDFMDRGGFTRGHGSQRIFDHFGDGRECDLLPQERLHRYLIGRVKRTSSRSSSLLCLIGQAQQREAIKIRGFKVPMPALFQSRRATGAGARSGQVIAYWIGIRMSVAQT